MPSSKRSPTKPAEPEHAPRITPSPFPGESPTVALAMAAGQKYGLHPEDEKPARTQPKRRKAPGKAPARKAGSKRAEKPARAKKGR